MKKIVIHIFTLLILFGVLAPSSVNAVTYDPANEEQVYTYLTDVMQLNKAAAAGVLANIQHESQFDPKAGVEDVNGYTSFGICQWNGPRFDALKAFCEEKGLAFDTLEGQLPYLQYELENEESGAYNKIKNVPDTVDGAYTAGYNWAKYFERCEQMQNGVDQYDRRGIAAEAKYWSKMPETAGATVSFDANGGFCLRTTKKVVVGNEIGLLPTPSKEGSTFVGWALQDGSLLSDTTVIQQNLTVMAKWTVSDGAPDLNSPEVEPDTDRPEDEPDTELPEVTPNNPQPVILFRDVPAGSYCYDAVAWAVQAGVTKGISDNTFSPDSTCSRAQVVTFIWRAAGSPVPTSSNNPFVDISAEQYYYHAVLWAVEQGITSGTSVHTFSPDAPCTRAQVSTFLWRSQGKPMVNEAASSFADVQPGAYYYDSVRWAAANGITNGVGNGMFAPNNACTRGQIVTFLYRGNSL